MDKAAFRGISAPIRWMALWTLRNVGNLSKIPCAQRFSRDTLFLRKFLGTSGMDSRETIRLRGKPPQTGPVTGRERQDETIGHAVTCAPTEGPFAPHTWKGPFTFARVPGQRQSLQVPTISTVC